MGRRIPLAAFTLLVASSARGQPVGTLSRFTPSETPDDDFALSRPIDLGHLRVGAQAHLDYANDPLVWETTRGDSETESASIVGHQLVATLGIALGLADRLVLHAGFPVALVMSGDDDTLERIGAPLRADGPGPGDLRFGIRARLLGDGSDVAMLGLAASLTFPTSGSAQFRGDGSLSFHPEALLELHAQRARIVLNVGVLFREDNIAGATNVEAGDELTYGLGVTIPVWQHPGETHIDVYAQAYGALGFVNAFARETTPLEALFGVKLLHRTGLTAGLAAGPGIGRGLGTPDLRAVLQIGYRSGAEPTPPSPEPSGVADRDDDGVLDPADACASEPEDHDDFEDDDGCPDPDNDQDGFIDGVDRCPREPETRNDFEDADGCPDQVGDRDGDAVLDTLDACPTVPEDRDDFEDHDGCPDPDNDHDGVTDRADGCPREAGLLLNHGCPDLDRDGDTLVDRLDNCPDVSGPMANQGCAEHQRVRIGAGRLELLEEIRFGASGAEVDPRSHPLLMNVAEVLRNHPEITYVRVEGHTDGRGDHDENVNVSRWRAESVRAFLIEHGGIDRARLVARGYGPDRPLVLDARTAAQRARNRRIELNLVPDEGEASVRAPRTPGATP